MVDPAEGHTELEEPDTLSPGGQMRRYSMLGSDGQQQYLAQPKKVWGNVASSRWVYSRAATYLRPPYIKAFSLLMASSHGSFR